MGHRFLLYQFLRREHNILQSLVLYIPFTMSTVQDGTFVLYIYETWFAHNPFMLTRTLCTLVYITYQMAFVVTFIRCVGCFLSHSPTPGYYLAAKKACFSWDTLHKNSLFLEKWLFLENGLLLENSLFLENSLIL